MDPKIHPGQIWRNDTWEIAITRVERSTVYFKSNPIDIAMGSYYEDEERFLSIGGMLDWIKNTGAKLFKDTSIDPSSWIDLL